MEDLTIYEDEINLNGTHRCTICNCTSREDIATNLGDYKKTRFMKDPKNPLFDICVECFESIQEVRNEFEFEELEDEWEIL